MISSVDTLLEPTAEPIVFEKSPPARMFDAEFLKRLVGRYETVSGNEISVELAGERLKLIAPGQPPYTLDPDLSGRFVLREFRLVSVGFELDADGRVVKAVLHQPNGVFDAVPIEE